MKKIIKNLPIASSGLLLAIFSLANLYDLTFPKSLTLLVGIILLSLLLSKIIFYRNIVKEELEQLVVLSTSGTFSMATMLFSTFLINLNYYFAITVWTIGLILHSLLIIVFSYRYVFKNFEIENVYASYWVVYVGITMASITGLSFNIQNFSRIFFIFGFVMMLITLPLVTYRYISYPVILEQNKPLKCIYAALINILIVGYVNSFTSINTYFLFSLYIIASIFYLYSLYKFITYRKIPFYPSYSAFTFPFVISAIASTKIFIISNYNLLLGSVALIETYIATLLVAYVLIKYVQKYVF
ncbi:MAG: TDT family transporter [Methanosphaera stadtmanae]|nr:TDT family transporter [Methanosphaera stadtmanae]